MRKYDHPSLVSMQIQILTKNNVLEWLSDTAEICSRLLVLTSSAAVKHVTPERAAPAPCWTY